jgi:TctA family transporter
MDTVSGGLRLTYGFNELLSGISFLIAVIGLFGIGELMLTMEEGLRFDGIRARVKIRDVFKTIATLPRYWVTLLRSAAVGCWMGITPGGPTAASFMSYGLAKRLSRRKEGFGQGEPEGVVAPEAAPSCPCSPSVCPVLQRRP